MNSTPRIMKETQSLMTNPRPGIRAYTNEQNPRHFKCEIDGETGTPYEGGKF